eukprot:m.429941 g.429941  ORF g.429941 m.429941 type:complete len:94 (-) comp56723_c0_seq7:3043-3324(-)
MYNNPICASTLSVSRSDADCLLVCSAPAVLLVVRHGFSRSPCVRVARGLRGWLSMLLGGLDEDLQLDIFLVLKENAVRWDSETENLKKGIFTC